MRVMVDANVLLSAVIFRSSNMLRVIEHASSEGNSLVLSSWVIGEVRRVVAKKWPDRAGSIEALLLALQYELVETPANEDIDWGMFEIRDPMDYPVLYSAVISDVDVFVSGDLDFSDVSVEGLSVLMPADYVSDYCL